MKKILFVIALTAICFSASAQNPSDVLNKFVGTWVYNKDGKEFKMVLKKVEVVVPNAGGLKTTMVEGYHYYKNNDSMVENSDEKEPQFTTGFMESRTHPNRLKITYHDRKKGKACDVILIYEPGDTPKLRWELIDQETTTIIADGRMIKGKNKGFTLPEMMVLDKVN